MINQKILCVGNETESTDTMVSDLAKMSQTVNHGLVSTGAFYPKEIGYYHTSIADIPAGDIVANLVQQFDLVIMLDQDIDSYPHFKSFVNTFRLMIELEKKRSCHRFSKQFRKHNHSLLVQFIKNQ